MTTASPDVPRVLRAIRELLTREGVAWREVEHGPAPTCEDAARERGEPLGVGGKCLLLKAGDAFGLFALSAALPLDSRRLRRTLGVRRLRFATEEELLRFTGLVPGALPPFGEPILPFPLHADQSLARGDRIAFNAGSLRHSMLLATRDWLRVARPRILSYAGPAEPGGPERLASAGAPGENRVLRREGGMNEPGEPLVGQEALRGEVHRLREQVRVVSDLATSLMSELDLEVVLPSVLSSARRFTRAEAGSLYVVTDGHLIFAEAQNDRLGTETETAPDLRLPIDESSLAGLAAARREVLDIPDVRQHPSLNRASRDAFGYEVVSMLVVPLTDHRGDVQGVLQLLNALGDDHLPVPFTEEAAWLSRIFGAHAATAMEIARLHGELKAVFDSFVGYTAQAIDARDAATAGHSSRVAAQACRVAEELGGFTPADLRELRFAGMFHDVGKIGVRERVLTKSDKLEPEALATVQERFRAACEAQVGRARIAAGSDEGHEAVVAAVDRASRLLADFDFVAAVNRPGWLPDDDLARLAELGLRTWQDWRGVERPLLTPEELEKLSVRKGNLTASERRDIELHVDHSYNFLKKIPFPRELARVPEIVWSHHEKVDGSGYPRGLAGEEIPIQSRILAAVDVFDALTATDRPYKKSMSPWKALDILDHEAEHGAWDPQVLAAMRRALEAGRLVSRRVMERRADDEPLDLARESWKKG